MNIDSLLSKIDLFNKLVIKSGFHRDLEDYQNSISQNRNLIAFKEISNKVLIKIKEFESYGLNTDLNKIVKDSKAFTKTDWILKLEVLNKDPEIKATQYSNQFLQILTQLFQEIDKNRNEIQKVEKVFRKYIENNYEDEQSEHQALISLVFRDIKSTSNIKQFSKALNKWQTALTAYQRLISSSSSEISLVTIQQGSIDVVLNMDVNIAIDLTELIKIGVKAFGAYLLYKSRVIFEIREAIKNSSRLEQPAKEMESILLDDILNAVKRRLKEQHKENLKSDKKIEKTSIDSKIEKVSKVIVDHIIKGNEVKYLNPPAVENDNEENSESNEELTKLLAETKENYRKLSKPDQKLLLEKFSLKEDAEIKE